MIPAVRGDTARPADAAVRAKLAAVIAEVHAGPSRIAAGTESRMAPSIAPKGRRAPFTGGA